MTGLLLLTAMASAGEVESVVWAQPFQLTEPAPYLGRGDHPSFSEGWIVQVEVASGSARARQTEQPVLYIGQWPARRVNHSQTGTCLVVWVPQPVTSGKSPVFFGPQTLPERVDESAGKAAAAAAEGAVRFEPTTVAKPLDGVTLDAVWAAAEERVRACSVR